MGIMSKIIGRKPKEAEVFEAILDGDTHKIEALLRRGANANAEDNGGKTTLMRASEGGCLDIAGHLIKAGAEINKCDEGGRSTALTCAAEKGYADIVNLLIDNGAQVQKLDLNLSGDVKTFQLLREALDNNSSDSYVLGVFQHGKLGLLYMDEDEIDLAINEYEMALKIEPANIEMIIRKGNAYREKEDHDQAIIIYEQALKIDPNLAQAHYNIGEIYEGQGRYRDAIECFQSFIELLRPRHSISSIRKAEERISRLRDIAPVPDV